MHRLSICAMTAAGLLMGALTANAEGPQYTYGSELMSIEERLGHREIMRRLPPEQREAYRLERHKQMMDRAHALGYYMPMEPPEVRASVGRWIHSPSQAYKPVESEPCAQARKETHSEGVAQLSTPAPEPQADWVRPARPAFMGPPLEPPMPPGPPAPPDPFGGSYYGPSDYYGGPIGGSRGWYGPDPRRYGRPGGYGGVW